MLIIKTRKTIVPIFNEVIQYPIYIKATELHMIRLVKILTELNLENYINRNGIWEEENEINNILPAIIKLL